MIKKNVLVIGGSGFIGAEICNTLSKTEMLFVLIIILEMNKNKHFFECKS